MTLSFRQIEDIIGETLCKSAYNYNAYWNPSATHILPHTIIEAGYEIVNVDLIGKSVELKKNKSCKIKTRNTVQNLGIFN